MATVTAIRGEVTCLICGRFLGVIERNGSHLRMVKSGTGGATPKVANGKLACSRCGGRAIIEQSVDNLYAA